MWRRKRSGPMLKRALVAGVVIGMPVLHSGTATAQVSAPASCVAIITSYEATQLQRGFVGREVSEFATSGPGLGAYLVGPLAHQHLDSFVECRAVEG
jgi:hypothetical protein